MKKLFLLPLFAICVSPAAARTQPTEELQRLDDALPGDLINNPLSLEWTKWGDGVKTKTVKASEIPGQFAVQADVKAAGKNPYDAGFNVPLTSGITKGDRLKIAVWARTTNAGETGKLRLRVQETGEPYDGFGDHDFDLDNVWNLHEYDTVATRDFDEKNGQIVMQIAFQKQLIEISSVYVMNLGPKKQK